ncbi:hypothetical protein AGABI1DRAFT_134741 [Agaricus bisporus var. burnettii JB137-S8]|uniref:Uncharacterized protein n=1 Tax=Agaricus bisporus var. burnettii (strain JB137-S8 / ATCC MYA-4627 / FGSC 10392) TaxID=597362 RepID=K5WRS4_AGABU|nr:uncharacterized protein AGABI1DRAFT_134741 [Agaricus bisporus var. burnettii JB137-S8]EKM73453.1 hypothetical protein AGABI1DRAFT_134741 [Agaricus bisporus var. burnettii JB137-S8]
MGVGANETFFDRRGGGMSTGVRPLRVDKPAHKFGKFESDSVRIGRHPRCDAGHAVEDPV